MSTMMSVLAAGPGPATRQDQVISWACIGFASLWLIGLMLSSWWRRFNTMAFPWGMRFSVPVILMIGAVGVVSLALGIH